MKHPSAPLLIAVILFSNVVHATGIVADPVVLAEAQRAWGVADAQLQRTLAYLDAIEPAGLYYPQFTENEAKEDRAEYVHGEWIITKEGGGTFWARGALPGMLFLLADRESDPVRRQALKDEAIRWATPILGFSGGDMSMNNLFVLRPWYHAAEDLSEREAAAGYLRQGAEILATPYDRATDTGNFHEDIGIMGYRRKADRTDNQYYFHAFIDHTPNVEQLVWASRINPEVTEAADWRSKALSHLNIISGTFGSNRNPGSAGTWQRSYWDWEESSPTYTQFLFNEAKQGHDDPTTWSRGQAWFVYGSSVAYAYTQDESLLPAVKEQLDFYLDHLPDRFPGDLRRQGKMVPSWDFDYALYGGTDPSEPDYAIPQPDTEVDTSAGAMALAGILQLVAALPDGDPDRARYLSDAEAILLELCGGEYLCDASDPELSILRHGCYHHSRCAVYPGPNEDNGLIWGDFFFVWALWCYLDLTEDKSDALETLRIDRDTSEAATLAIRYTRPVGSLPFGFRLEHSADMETWEALSPMEENVVPAFDGTESVELLLEPGSAEWGGQSFIRLVR
ncbi:MAG: hypothetical protein ACP5I4_00880 [Oceanipulchritudo sp.]